MKYLPALLAINSLLIVGLQHQKASATTLYSGTGLPENQSPQWLAPGAIDSNGFPIATFNATTGTDGVTVQTDNIDSSPGATATSGYLGYSNYTADTSNPFDIKLELVNPSFPILNADDGYSVFFNLAVNPLLENDPNRASFGVIAISSDKTKGIELNFEADLVFAQSEADSGSGFSEFTRAENAPVDTSVSRNYELKIQNSTYELFADNTFLLTGNLRDYEFDADNSEPPLPFNPYETPNLLFLGDSTDQAAGSFTLGEVRVEADASVSTPEFSPIVALSLLGVGMGASKLAQKNKF